jgi:hypothetical protein
VIFELYTIHRKARMAALCLFLSVFLSACGYYSFSGVSIPSHLGTISIPLVQDNSVSVIESLDAQMTELLINQFVRQTRLSLEPRPENGDALLEVTISRYQNLPTSVTSEERAARNRVTITATARYDDQVENASLLDRSFSAFEEYDPLDPEQEQIAALAVLSKLVNDIFTAATSNW